MKQIGFQSSVNQKIFIICTLLSCLLLVAPGAVSAAAEQISWSTANDWQAAEDRKNISIQQDSLIWVPLAEWLEIDQSTADDWADNHSMSETLKIVDDSLTMTTDFIHSGSVAPDIGDSFVFSNAGASGDEGPTQAQLLSYYDGTNLEGTVESDNGIQIWNVPVTGTYRFRLYGAEGGGANNSHRGQGGHAEGWLELEAGETLAILVGQAGQYGHNQQEGPPGGFGGGGRGGDAHTSRNDYAGSSGGGASDIRIGGHSLHDRVIVAAGGGGGAGNGSLSRRDGGGGAGGGGWYGGGGGSAGNMTQWGGLGGMPNEGGEGGFCTNDNSELDGQFGVGGRGGNTNSTSAQTTSTNVRGGDGGGRFGQMGARNSTTNRADAGGGGSSYTDGVNDGLTESGINHGHGQVIIEVLDKVESRRIDNPHLLDIPEVEVIPTIEWTATEPAGTQITFRTAVSDNPDTPPHDSDWMIAQNGQSVPNISTGDDLTGKYLWILQDFATANTEVTPYLHELKVNVTRRSNQGFLLSDKRQMLSTRAMLDSIDYQLNGEQIWVTVIGSPGTPAEEHSNQIQLTGQSNVEIGWEDFHTTYQVRIDLQTSDYQTTPRFHGLSLLRSPRFDVEIIDEPSRFATAAGEKIRVYGRFTNIDDHSYRQTVELRVNDQVVDTNSIRVDPGRWQQVPFEYRTELLDDGAELTVTSGDFSETRTITVLNFDGGLGSPEHPYRITDWYQLTEIERAPYAHYSLENNLSSQTAGYSNLVDTPDGWQPLGSTENPFSGVFQGNDRTVYDLQIDRPSSDDVGLFGVVTGDPDGAAAEISNLHLKAATVTGRDNTALLAGYTRHANLSHNSVKGSLTGNNNVGGLTGELYLGAVAAISSQIDLDGNTRVGGVVGKSRESTIKNSYAVGKIDGTFEVGGVVGELLAGSLENSFAAAELSGLYSVGGLIGSRGWEAAVQNSFWDVEASQTDQSDGGYPLPTSDMQNIETFIAAGWTINRTAFDENNGYPYLSTSDPTSWMIPAQQIPLTINIEGNGTVLLNEEPVSGELWVPAGETISVEAVPAEFWEFGSWSEALTSSATSEELVVNYQQRLTAQFDQTSRLLTINLIGEGEVMVNNRTYTAPVELPAGDPAQLRARPGSGWSFSEWSSDYQFNSTRSRDQLPMVTDKTVTAKFIEGGRGLRFTQVGPVPFRSDDGTIRFEFNSFNDGPFEIELFTITGERIFDARTTDDPYVWDVRNNSGNRVRSGHYIYRLKESSTGDVETGRIAIIR